MDQETGIASPTGVLCPGGMELAGSDGHLDGESPATSSSGFLRSASRSFLKRSFRLLIVFLYSCLRQLRTKNSRLL